MVRAFINYSDYAKIFSPCNLAFAIWNNSMITQRTELLHFKWTTAKLFGWEHFDKSFHTFAIGSYILYNLLILCNSFSLATDRCSKLLDSQVSEAKDFLHYSVETGAVSFLCFFSHRRIPFGALCYIVFPTYDHIDGVHQWRTWKLAVWCCTHMTNCPKLDNLGVESLLWQMGHCGLELMVK